MHCYSHHMTVHDDGLSRPQIDGMARSGHLKDSYAFFMEHGIEHEEAWSAILSGRRKFDDMELAEMVLNEMKELFHSDSNRMGSAAVTLSHIYAKRGEFEKLKMIRKEMEEKGWRQRLGKSTIEIDAELHSFTAGMKLEERYEIEVDALCDR